MLSVFFVSNTVIHIGSNPYGFACVIIYIFYCLIRKAPELLPEFRHFFLDICINIHFYIKYAYIKYTYI